MTYNKFFMLQVNDVDNWGSYPDYSPMTDASATLLVILNFISSPPTVLCATGCCWGCLRLNSALTQKRIISIRSSVVSIIYLQQEIFIISHIPLWCGTFGPPCYRSRIQKMTFQTKLAILLNSPKFILGVAQFCGLFVVCFLFALGHCLNCKKKINK